MFSSLKNRTGAEKLQHPIMILLLVAVAVALGVIIAKGGLIIAMALLALFPAIIYFNRFLNDPRVGLYTVVVLGFIAIAKPNFLLFGKFYFQTFIRQTFNVLVAAIAERLFFTNATGAPGINFPRFHLNTGGCICCTARESFVGYLFHNIRIFV